MDIKRTSFRDWITENTEFENIKLRIFDAPSSGISAWARTTAGVIALLLFIQFLTGILMAFHYVPTVSDAFTTVSYIELVLSLGTFIRSLHYHASVLLPIVLIAHLAQMLFRKIFAENTTSWIFAIALLTFCLTAGATGYALPWDARALNGVNVAVSIASNVPLIGNEAKSWLQNGASISTLTLSRFYGLHVFIIPFLILLSISLRLFVFGKKRSAGEFSDIDETLKQQLFRNSITIGIAFISLAAFSMKFPAPFGPPIQEAQSFLPRPGPQFLWLFEMQKYTDGMFAALLAFGFPALILGGLFLLPFMGRRYSNVNKARIAGALVLSIGTIAVGVLTVFAIYQDSADPKAAIQLAEQAQAEAEFRMKAFKPKTIDLSAKIDHETEKAGGSVSDVETVVEVPNSYKINCAKCHGENGEGAKKFPELKGVTSREEDKLSDQNLIEIMNDPKAYGLSSKMPSFRDKLAEAEKLEIVKYIKSLK